MSKTYTKTYKLKSGEVVTRTYTRESVRVLNKDGSVSKPFLNRVQKELGVTLTYAELADISATTKRLLRNSKAGRITPQRVVASYTHNKVEGMLVNTGFSNAEIAQQADTNIENLLDNKNWTFEAGRSFYTNQNGDVYEFVFRYNGSVMDKL